MLAKRIIPCLDVKDGRVVKGINFLQLRDAGNPVELAQRYNMDGADELVFLDITASYERRETLKNLVRAVATEIEIPFTVGGGIRNVDDVQTILRNGADKIAINTAAVESPDTLKEIAEIFGAQCIVLAIDAKRNYNIESGKIVVETEQGPCWFEAYTYGGRKPTGLDAITWASTAAKLGAGELLVTSMDRDGTKNGYDNILNSTISTTVNVPLVASGGAGEPIHFLEVFTEGKADAALAASVFHYESYPVSVIKQYLSEKEVNVRI
jgi:cyclase